MSHPGADPAAATGLSAVFSDIMCSALSLSPQIVIGYLCRFQLQVLLKPTGALAVGFASSPVMPSNYIMKEIMQWHNGNDHR